MDVTGLTARNARCWSLAKLTRGSAFAVAAKRLCAAKSRYQLVAAKTGVPWFIIAVIHEREASQSWASSIAQGDPWNRVSTHAPKGRGPFGSWEEAAVDALVNCPPFAARWKDWSAGGALALLEQYNGLGYAQRGLPSPYIWAGTDQYVRGKYVSDGVFDPTAVDHQLGCAGLIMAMREIDSSIGFTGETKNVAAHPATASTKAVAPAAASASTASAPSDVQHGFAALVIALGVGFGSIAQNGWLFFGLIAAAAAGVFCVYKFWPTNKGS